MDQTLLYCIHRGGHICDSDPEPLHEEWQWLATAKHCVQEPAAYRLHPAD